MKWLYTFAVVTRPWFEQAEGSLCRPRGGLLTARARCFEDHIRNLVDAEGSSSLGFLRVLMAATRLHSRAANPELGWLAGGSPAQQAAWERFEREDLLIEMPERAVFLPPPAALERWLAGQAAPAGAGDAFNRALRDGLLFLQANGGVLLVTGRRISASFGETLA